MKFTLSGTGELHYQDEVYTLKAGDIFFIDCKNYQYYKTISSEPWEMDWVHFSGGNTESFYHEFIKNGSNILHTNSENVRNNPIHLLMEKLLQLQKDPNAKTDFESSVLVHELLNELILQSYIDENYRQGVTLEDLEKHFHLNKYQIVKDFSKFMGQPPVDYQISCKISYAKDLLRYSNLSIKEISLEAGLDNFAYFSRLFKKKTGISPSEYRRTDRVIKE